MKYFSLNDIREHKTKVSFKEAMIRGLAPDKGLYFPESVPQLPPDFLENLPDHPVKEIALKVISPFIGDEIAPEALEQIVTETLNFDIPLKYLGDHISTLELFHGPTMAFKDVGARFMARCLGYFTKDQKTDKVRVLVATSGDTGGAVANGFLAVPGVEVIILYPDGMVSDIQERQLTTLGKNITALKVKGNFDDCQRMVKTAFLDSDLDDLNLTSANSINIARWLPQMLYYFLAVRQLQQQGKNTPVLFSVPSGNFGNICAGVLASAMGLKIDHFVASTNSNDTIPRYLTHKIYEPLPTRPTISNAMDVSDPSNFIRIEHLFDQVSEPLKSAFSALSFNDTQTREALKELKARYDYTADPHGAVGYLGAKAVLDTKPGYQAVFLETAHPVKFLQEVEKTLGIQLSLPPQIQAVMKGEKTYQTISSYKELTTHLMKT